MPASIEDMSASEGDERQGRPSSRSGHHSRSHSEAGTHRTDHTATTITHVHVHGKNGKKHSKKQSKAKKEDHKKKAREVPLNVLEAEVTKRRAQLKTTKEEQLANNLEIDRLYRAALDKCLERYQLKESYVSFFRQFFETKKAREEVFYNIQDKSDEEEKSFREYWRTAENEKLKEFLKTHHVAAAPERSKIAKNFYEKLKESKAKLAAETAKQVAALVAAQKTLESGGADPITRVTDAAPVHMYDEGLWGAGTRARL